MNIAVIGLGFGDEGKGCTVDWLCDRLSDQIPVVRYSGGHQAGHNVIANGVDHVFSNFGSGTIRGSATYWESQCMIDPIALHNEYKRLIHNGIIPKLFIHGASPITTPLERHVNRTDGYSRSHGTCGNGIRATQIREENYYSITAMDIKYPEILKEKYELCSEYFYNICLEPALVEEFMVACEWLCDCPDITISNFELPEGDKIFESSQGLLLDKNIGFFPHVTPSNVGMLHFDKTDITIGHCYYVTRGYQTRHGNGYMTDHGDEAFNDSIGYAKVETNPTNEYQGEFKRSMLDLDLLEYALIKDGCKIQRTLVITCLEHMKQFKFHYKGTIYTSDNARQYCEDICRILDISRYVMCADHKFSDFLYL